MQLRVCSSLNSLLCPQKQVTKYGAICFIIGVCCVTITWQQIFEYVLEVTGVGVLPHITIERRHPGRHCFETVTADNGKPSRFISMVGELRLADICCVAFLDK